MYRIRQLFVWWSFVRSWPNPAVHLSISGHQAEKVADCHEGQEPTLSGPILYRLSTRYA